MPGKIQLVATPIGNLADLSQRAATALENADLIACEDTRHTGRLLAHLGIKAKLLSLHEHNERGRTPQVLEVLAQGGTVAVVSDAGSPLVSDPGYSLVRAALDEGHRIEAIPGASAVITALLVSGLEPQPFTFAGFTPPKSGKRKRFFERFTELEHTLIVYESPHRIVASLNDAREVFGDRRGAIARELTKLHEETLRGRLSEIEEALAKRPKVKGELVLLIARSDDS